LKIAHDKLMVEVPQSRKIEINSTSTKDPNIKEFFVGEVLDGDDDFKLFLLEVL